MVGHVNGVRPSRLIAAVQLTTKPVERKYEVGAKRNREHGDAVSSVDFLVARNIGSGIK